MIHIETIEINGTQYIKTYSDTYTIVRDGVEYGEAVDPLNSGRTYIETENPLDTANEDPEEATKEDYKSALSEFGVNA